MTKRYSMTDGVRKEMTDAEIAELKQDAPLTDLEIYMNRVRRKRNTLDGISGYGLI